jgi:hypothetical protein
MMGILKERTAPDYVLELDVPCPSLHSVQLSDGRTRHVRSPVQSIEHERIVMADAVCATFHFPATVIAEVCSTSAPNTD